MTGRLRVGASAIAHAAALVALMLVTLYWSEPYYNWDMVPYIAVAHQLGGASLEGAHQATYHSIRQNIPQSAYELLVDGSEYRRTVAGDAAVLSEQLPFYRVKPAYPWLILQLQRLGVNSVRASVLVPMVAYIALGFLLLVWLEPMIGRTWGVLVSGAMMSLPFVLDLARLATPDALSTLIVMLALWLAFQGQRVALGVCVLLVSIMVRPDNALWLLAVTASCAVTKRLSIIAATSTVVAGTLVYFALAQWSDNPGWVTLFYHSFVERVDYASSFQSPLTPVGYLRVYLRETHPVNLPRFTLLFLLLGGFVFVSRFRSYGNRDVWIQLLATSAAFAALHWVAFPEDDRYLVAAYLVTLLALTRTLVRDASAPAPVAANVPPTAQQVQ